MGRAECRAGTRANRAIARAVAAALVAALACLGLAGRAAGMLPAGAMHGPHDQLRQYPVVSLASPEQRAAARALLDAVWAASSAWTDPGDALAAGYGVRPHPRDPGDTHVGWLHADRRPGPPYLDPANPKSVIYANAPGQPLVLVGVMFTVPRGERGPTPGGPITRWHTHTVCIRGDERGSEPRHGRCSPGTVKRQGSEMMHIWLTEDLRSAFAIHAPIHELCLAGYLPERSCDHSKHSHG